MNCSSLYVTLASPNVEALVTFYEALLGQGTDVLIPSCYAEFRLTGLRLGIFKPRPDHTNEFQAATSGGMSLCWDVEDLEDAIATLTHLGHPPPGPILSASHGREVYAYDPDGNRLILHQPNT
ncbi:MAG: VOC family protein [Nodosilinea sp.]